MGDAIATLWDTFRQQQAIPPQPWITSITPWEPMVTPWRAWWELAPTLCIHICWQGVLSCILIMNEKRIGICRCSLLKRAAQPHYFNNGFNSHQTASIRFNQPGLAIMKGWCYKLTYGSPFRYGTKQNRSSPLYMLLHVPAAHQRSPTAANVKPFGFNDNMSDPKTLN